MEPLIKFASKHTEDMLTCMSVRALGDIGDNRAVDTLIAILEDQRTADGLHSHLRLEVCWTLAKLRDAKALESLIKVVEGRSQDDSGIREAAASALVELDDDRIELPLLKFFRAKLEERVKLEEPEHQQDAVVKAIIKLMARLIDKSKDV